MDARDLWHRARPSATRAARDALPIVSWLPRYDKRLLVPDAIAALAVWALLVPQGLAYASLAGVPAQAGLYAALAALLLYAIFGTCRNLNVGPSSAIAALSAATIAPLAGGDATTFVALSAAAALLAGGLLVAAGVARLGFVAEFFAKPVLTGFVTGLALTVASSQAPKIFGITIEDGNFFEDVWRLVATLDETSIATFAVGAGTILVIVVLSRFLPKIPAGLIAVVLALVLSTWLDLEADGVSVVGEIPRGLPSYGLPDVGLGQVLDLMAGVAGIALLAFAESIAGARSLASRQGYEVDPNKELVALGAANIGAGLSQGFSVDASLSRSAVGERAGVKTQVSGLLGAGLLIVTLFALAPLFRNLPDAALAGLVITAVAGLVDVRGLRRLARLDWRDFCLAILALAGVLLFGILEGLVIAVVASLLVLVWRAYRPASAVLGRLPGAEEPDETFRFRNIAHHPGCETFPGLVIFRFENELFFANANGFRAEVRALVRDTAPTVREVLVDAGSISYADTTATDMLLELIDELRAEGIVLAFGRAKAPLRAILDRSGVAEALGPEHLHDSVRAGVADYLRRNPGVEPVRAGPRSRPGASAPSRNSLDAPARETRARQGRRERPYS